MHSPAAAFQALAMLQEEQRQPRCPRCDSPNTKFCYYNNYNLSQPRHYCRDCRRYWTRGGALRNVPVGGGTRKSSKRAAAAASSSAPEPASKRPGAPPPAGGTHAADSPPREGATILRGPDGGDPVTPASPPRGPAEEDGPRLPADANCRKGGGGRLDLSIDTPGSKCP